MKIMCKNCEGEGSIGRKICLKCNGTGEVEENDS